MRHRTRACLHLLVFVLVGAGLMIIFPSTLRFAEAAAREIRYLWWIILLIGLAIWFIWSGNRRPRE